jgi:hypothetical protein
MDKDIIQILWSALLIVIVTIVPLVKKFKEMQRKELRSASAAHPPRCPDSEKRPASPQKLKKRNLRYATRSAYPERTPNSNLIAPVSPKNSTCEKRSFIRR